MIRTVLYKVALERRLAGGQFPLRLGRQSRAGPTGISVCFKETEMANRLLRRDRPEPREGIIMPTVVLLLPVKRAAPLILVHRKPAEREPQFRARITALFDKLYILRIGHKSRGQLEWGKKLLVTRAFVIEGEAFIALANPMEPAGKFQP